MPLGPGPQSAPTWGTDGTCSMSAQAVSFQILLSGPVPRWAVCPGHGKPPPKLEFLYRLRITPEGPRAVERLALKQDKCPRFLRSLRGRGSKD